MKSWPLTMTVPAVALAFLAGCSSDSGGTTDAAQAPATTAATQVASASASTSASAATSTSTPASTSPAGNKSEACKQLGTIKQEMIKSLTTAMTGDGKVPPAKAKTILSGTAGKLQESAAKADGDVAVAMKGLAHELSKASSARDPFGELSADHVSAAGVKLDKACGNA